MSSILKIKECKNKSKNCGSTMVEVLIGFALLSIIVAGFTKIINLSTNMVIQSKDMLHEAELLEEKLYQGGEPDEIHSGVRLVEVTTTTDSLTGNVVTQKGQELSLDGVIVQTFGIEGYKGEIYTNRFSHISGKTAGDEAEDDD